MTKLFAKGGEYHFESVAMGLKKAGVKHTSNNHEAILLWHDSLKDSDYFSSMKLWQVTNRIPALSILTRKATLAKLIGNASKLFPSEYNFVPQEYILPDQYDEFCEMLKTTKKTWIVKPDEGSLGVGIQIIEPGQNVEIPKQPAVAQEYIESATLHNKKFDLRIYVLIASVNPLRIYVYRDGLARFCSEEVGVDPVYSRLTNVTLNKQHNTNFKDISRMISDVFPELEEIGVDTDKIWKEIDDIVTKTILSGINYLTQAERQKCPIVGYSRCFQVLGFDILLDKNYKPWVLEANFRPNLDYHRGVERRLKSNMIKEAVNIAAPYRSVQETYLFRKNSWDQPTWKSFVGSNKELKKSIHLDRIAAEENSLYYKAFSSVAPQPHKYMNLYNTFVSLPLSCIPNLLLPVNYIRGGEA